MATNLTRFVFSNGINAERGARAILKGKEKLLRGRNRLPFSVSLDVPVSPASAKFSAAAHKTRPKTSPRYLIVAPSKACSFEWHGNGFKQNISFKESGKNVTLLLAPFSALQMGCSITVKKPSYAET